MNETLRTIHSLRSIHGNFSGREIADNDLKIILEAAVRAATASAQQSYSIIVVDDRKTIRESFDYEGSKALVFCVDYNRLIRTADYIGCNYSTGGLQAFITGSTDTILAAQTAAIAAKSLGIDSLFTNSVHRNDLSRFKERFDLPEQYCFPLITLILGYPDQEPEYQRGRLKGPGLIHRGRYQKLTEKELERLIVNYDDEERHLCWSPQNQGKAHLEWFFNHWHQSFLPEKDDIDPICIELKRTGFLS